MNFRLICSALFLTASLGVTWGQKPQLVLPIIHQYAALDLEYSADGKYLVSCARTELKLWEAQTGRLILTIANDTQRPNTKLDDCPLGFQQVAVAPDGSYIVSARYCEKQEDDSHNKPNDETAGPTYIEVWDTKTATLKRQIKISDYRVFVWEITLSPDGKQVALTTTTKVGFYGYIDGEVAVTVWEVESGVQLLERHSEQGGFSAQNNVVLTKGSNAIHKVNTLTKMVESSFFLDAEPIDMGTSPDGTRVFALTEGKLWVWGNSSANPTTYEVPESAEYGARPFFSSDGKILTLLNWQQSALVRYQIADGKQIESSSVNMPQGPGAIPRLAIAPDHQLIAFAHYPNVGDVTPAIKGFFPSEEDKSLSYGAVDIPSGLLLILYSIERSPERLKILANGQLIAVEDAFGNQHVFHTATNRYYRSDLETFQVVQMQQHGLAIMEMGQGTSADPTFKISIYDSQGKLSQIVDKLSLGVYPSLYFDPQQQQLFFQINTNQRRYLDLASGKIGSAQVGPEPAASQPPLHPDFELSTKDKTSISLLRKRDGAELAKILLFGNRDWVVATPSGLFDGSDAGKQALHFVNGLEVIPLESYEARYWVPGFIGKAAGWSYPKANPGCLSAKSR